MPNHPSAAIANAFVDLNGGPMPQMKLHKLAYIAHGWNLAVNEEPLIADTVEAWDNGPVFRLIWNQIRDFGTDRRGHVRRHNGEEFSSDLSAAEMAVIKHVWNRYRKYDANELSAMTHEPGTPWTKTYFGRYRNAPIPNELIRQHYVELGMAGRVSA